MDFKRIQADTGSEAAAELAPLLHRIITAGSVQDSTEKSVLNLMADWNHQMRPGSPEAAFYEVMLMKLIRNTFHDEMGDTLYRAFLRCPQLPRNGLSHILRRSDPLWFDVISTPGIETMEQIVQKSFHEAVTFLKDRFGSIPRRWTWGTLHTLGFRHPLGIHPLLTGVFNLGPFHLGGSNETIHRTGYALDDPYRITSSAAARIIFDLAYPNNSVSVIPTGQSGQPMDEHYRDQIQLYLGHLYHPNLFDSTKVVDSGWDLLHLQPGQVNE